MSTPKQNYNKLVRKYGIKTVANAIELLIEQQQPAYVSGMLIPSIIEQFGYTKKEILSSLKFEHKNARKLLLYLSKEFLNISTHQLAEHFKLSQRTTRRHIKFVKDVISKDISGANLIYKEFKENTITIITKIEKERYGNR